MYLWQYYLSPDLGWLAGSCSALQPLLGLEMHGIFVGKCGDNHESSTRRSISGCCNTVHSPRRPDLQDNRRGSAH